MRHGSPGSGFWSDSIRAGLAEHFGRDAYLRCESMGALIRENLESIRRSVGRPIVAELVPE